MERQGFASGGLWIFKLKMIGINDPAVLRRPCGGCELCSLTGATKEDNNKSEEADWMSRFLDSHCFGVKVDK
jgi:hypothetical protein